MINAMDALDAYFPYSRYRPYQRQMLEFAAQVSRDGGIAMIDAPTGSGKSSVVAALLAERKGRKIIIAVRTVSQLTTFIRELSLVKKKQPQLKVVYLAGKAAVCPLGGEGDVYRKCEGVKAFSTSLMRDRAGKGALFPLKDLFIRQQIRRMDRDHPILCPYFIASRSFVPAGATGPRMVPSTALLSRIDHMLLNPVAPQDLGPFCGEVCPYELLMHAARSADVIILNYHHLFDKEIREQVYANLYIEPSETLLLIDEAHNCGDVITGIESSTLAERDLEQASRELTGLRRHHKGAAAVQHVLPRLSGFIKGLGGSHEAEDWFDPVIFERMIVKESLYSSLEEIVDELIMIDGLIRAKNVQAGQYRETGIERLTSFLFRLEQSATDPANLTIYRRQDDGLFSLEVRNIDPSLPLQEICSAHACCILISGTLSPVAGFSKYYFGDTAVSTLALPNAFPKKNRLVCCAGDITTAFSRRQDRANISRVVSYILSFCMPGGNRAIYFPSYQILETYAALCIPEIQGKKVVIEPRDATDAGLALTEFLSLPSRGESGVIFAVCGGKWSEGLDYRGEMLGGALVIGLPLAPFNRVRRMVIDYFRYKFGDEGEFLCYTLPAINRALQALGRVIRTPEDRGVQVLGDKRFLEAGVKNALPQWIQDEMIVCDAAQFREMIMKWKS